MIRLESKTGWWLVTHPDHARLAGEFAAHWGNERFAVPKPRESVLLGISVHDDGWAQRDAAPAVTRLGKPAAFSTELVGKYTAFEEIDLSDYLAVRERAVEKVEAVDAYAALLVSMHTYNLLTERADRATIAAEQVPLLDAFLDRQRGRQERLRGEIRTHRGFPDVETSDEALLKNFRLLQAVDNLSLLSCVDFGAPGSLLHPLALVDGGSAEVSVIPLGARVFRLAPYPLDAGQLTFVLPVRHVEGKEFRTAEDLRERFLAAPVEGLVVTVTG